MSGSYGNININITAQATGVNTAAAAAQQAIYNLGQATQQAAGQANTFNTAYQTMGQTAQAAAQGLNQAAQAAQQAATANATLATNANTATTGLNSTAHASTGVYRELIVLGHEAMQGNFSRFGGSLVVMTERMGALNLATVGIIGTLGLAAAAAFHFAEAMGAVHSAQNQISSVSAFFNPAMEQDMQNTFTRIKELPGVSVKTAQEVVNAFGRMQGMTGPVLNELADQVLRFSKTGESAETAAKQLGEAWADPKNKGEEYLRSIGATNEELMKYSAITGQNAPAQQRAQILEDLNIRTARVAATTANAAEAQHKYIQEQIAASNLDPEGFITLTTGKGPLDDIINKQKVDDQIADAQRLKDAMANISNYQQLPKTEQVTWFQKMTEGADELRLKTIDSVNDPKRAQQQIASSLAQYWQGVQAQAEKGSKDEMMAHEKYLQYKGQADLDSLKMSTKVADDGTRAQIASLNAQIAAAKGHNDQIIALEDQKLSILSQKYGENSRQYQEELKRKIEMQQQFEAQSVASAESAIKAQEKLDQDQLQEKIKSMNAAVAGDRTSKQAALDNLIQFTQQVGDNEIAQVDQLLKTLQQGTKAYQDAYQERLAIASRTEKQIETFQAQEAADAAKQANQQAREYQQMFDEIGSASKSSITELIEGRMTWQQAEAKVAGAVLQSFVGMATQMIGRWIVTQLAMTTISETNTAARNAITTAQNAGGTGFGALISGWLGLETTKTAITSAATTQRAAVENTSFLGRVATQIAQWLGLETSKTAATTVQTATRSTIEKTADTGTLGITLAQNEAEAQSYAAVGATAAGASVAAIPITGWALAPGVTATTYGLLAGQAAMASYEVGTVNVPQTGPAMLHQGEMVVPADFASGLRSGAVPGFTNNSASNNYSPTINVNGQGASMSDISQMLQRSQTSFFNYMNNIMNGGMVLPGRMLS